MANEPDGIHNIEFLFNSLSITWGHSGGAYLSFVTEGSAMPTIKNEESAHPIAV